jgi:hypothetical protein
LPRPFAGAFFAGALAGAFFALVARAAAAFFLGGSGSSESMSSKFELAPVSTSMSMESSEPESTALALPCDKRICFLIRERLEMVTDLSFGFALFGLLDVLLFVLLLSLDQLYASSAMNHARQRRTTNQILQFILINPLIRLDALHQALERLRHMPTTTSASTPTLRPTAQNP